MARNKELKIKKLTKDLKVREETVKKVKGGYSTSLSLRIHTKD